MQFSRQEPHESLEVSGDHLYPILPYHVGITYEGPAFQSDNLSGLTIDGKQRTTTVRAEHDDSPTGHAAQPRWLSTTHPRDHALGLIDKEPRTDIRKRDPRNMRIELDQISHTRATQDRSERIATAIISGP
ncbi:hypothetical protein SaccyDRAFT_2269 [Saccharomonospora cyanea NA-134]|uniref:Uncharacterized protein n=1 Tax=Saccharomonospora cyanea NA-134 TaxID=882082 RepID=H5XPS2_9PSEU|nr:hypothetical protein SaccyDRAFT_2269 [Saccharomonospora cyanea NA-134]